MLKIFKFLLLLLAGNGFWVAAFIIAFLYYPFVYFLPVSKSQKEAISQNSNAFFFNFFIKTLEFFGLLRITINGKELIPINEGCLIVSNHPTLLDVLILMGKLPRLNCVVKKEILSHKVLGIGVRCANYLSNENPLDFISEGEKLIRSGKRVLIFPEGTRTKPGEEVQFTKGAASLGVLASCKIVPIFITSSPNVLYKGHSWRDLKEFPIHYEITLKEPLDPKLFKKEKRPTAALKKKLENLYHL